MKNNDKIVPRISLIIHEKTKKRQLRLTPKKMKKILRTTLKSVFKFDVFVTFRVVYGKMASKEGKMEIFENTMTTNSYRDLVTAFEAFLDKDLWLVRA